MCFYWDLKECNVGSLGYPYILVNGTVWNLNNGQFTLPFVIDKFAPGTPMYNTPSGKKYGLRVCDPGSGPVCESQSFRFSI